MSHSNIIARPDCWQARHPFVGLVYRFPSQFMAALWKVRHLCTHAEHVRPTVPGSYILVQAIMSAIDDYAERETGNREYFWGKPHKAG
jgi:hypothetical protein